MASFVTDHLIKYMANGSVAITTDTFKCCLLTSSYTPSKAHDYRDDAIGAAAIYEVVGTGYTAGGNAATPTVDATDTAGHTQTISWSITSWTSSTITARYGAIYKVRGGAASADELVAILDFGSNQSSSSGTFAISVTTPMTWAN